MPLTKDPCPFCGRPYQSDIEQDEELETKDCVPNLSNIQDMSNRVQRILQAGHDNREFNGRGKKKRNPNTL